MEIRIISNYLEVCDVCLYLGICQLFSSFEGSTKLHIPSLSDGPTYYVRILVLYFPVQFDHPTHISKYTHKQHPIMTNSTTNYNGLCVLWTE